MTTTTEIIASAQAAIALDLMVAAGTARSETSQSALTIAAHMVANGYPHQARKILAPLRTRAARTAIIAIKAL